MNPEQRKKIEDLLRARGLFRSSKGIIINSDVNAGYNIIRKSEPEAFANGVGGCVLHPISFNPLRSNN